MWKNEPGSNRRLAKIAEIFFASGIPVVALAKFANDRTAFVAGIPLLVAIVAAGGWHIKTLNDNCELQGKMGGFGAGVIVPLLMLAVLISFKPGTALPVALIVLNWDFYSVLGKNCFMLSMLNNFLGGFLHFTLGLAAGGAAFPSAALSTEAFFFGFVMLCGSMHHDAYHAVEDEARNSITGAVRFGPDIWWRLAAFPMIVALFFLARCEALLGHIFLVLAVAPYFIGYFSVLLRADTPSTKTSFRIFCRISFGLSAICYIFVKLFL